MWFRWFLFFWFAVAVAVVCILHCCRFVGYGSLCICLVGYDGMFDLGAGEWLGVLCLLGWFGCLIFGLLLVVDCWFG